MNIDGDVSKKCLPFQNCILDISENIMCFINVFINTQCMSLIIQDIHFKKH